jgi:hypothetical protein|tara:strand:- start:2 stop:196 length:195 start_codon:yes stop_codon:yes gene_type:complete
MFYCKLIFVFVPKATTSPGVDIEMATMASKSNEKTRGDNEDENETASLTSNKSNEADDFNVIKF